MAGLERLLERLCAKLAQHRMGARRVRLELRRVDRGTAQVEIGLARPMRDPVRIAALLPRGGGRSTPASASTGCGCPPPWQRGEMSGPKGRATLMQLPPAFDGLSSTASVSHPHA